MAYHNLEQVYEARLDPVSNVHSVREYNRYINVVSHSPFTPIWGSSLNAQR